MKAIEVKFNIHSKIFSSIFQLKIRRFDLVFLKKSPDYCDFDEKTGSLGTNGRICSINQKISINTIPSCSYFNLESNSVRMQL